LKKYVFIRKEGKKSIVHITFAVFFLGSFVIGEETITHNDGKTVSSRRSRRRRGGGDGRGGEGGRSAFVQRET